MVESMETFKPGLFDIGLNIEKKLSNHYLVIENNELNKILKTEPNYIRPAIHNLQAVFFFHMDTGRSTARSILENLIKEDPKDLNALDGLVYVYKKMGRKKDSDYYKQQLELYKDDRLSQAKSILGQAYALTYDLPDDHNKSPEFLLKDSWRQLKTKSKHPKEISKANESIAKTCKLVKTIPEASHEKKIDAKQMAVEKFEKGIKMLEMLKCSAEEILVWKHNLAIARNRLDTWRNRRGDDIKNRFENYVKILEAHLDVIENLSPTENLEEPLKIYVAKSYIYFVQVYTSWKGCSEQELPEEIKGQDFDSMLEKAISICPDNYIILYIYGQYWSNKGDFLKAIDIYNKSIELNPHPEINWFAYSGRRDAYYYYSLKLIKEESDQIIITKNLQHAYDDGKVCMQSKCTDTCMYQMAQICYKLSIPDKNQFECQKIDFIYEALEIIHEALNKRDISKDSKFYTLLGNCYPYIGEFRKGIESLKTALELNKWSEDFPDVFKTLSRVFIAFFEREKDTNLLTEFRFMLKEASRRGRHEWITTAMQMMQEKHTEVMISLVQNMIQWDAKGCKEIIKKALTYRECKALMGQFQIKLQEEDNQETEINGPNDIQNSEKTSSSFQYDFFVSHSEKDKDWVNNMLRPNLEEYDEEIKFKEYRKGIESLKTALELNKWSENFPDVFKTLSRGYIAFLKGKKDRNLLTVFRFMLKEASQRCRDEWITTAMQMMQEKHTEVMISLVQNMIQWDAKGCKEIIKKALTYRECKALMGQFQIKLQEEDNQETEINGPNDIQNSEKTSIQYDFFVSHSEKDKDRVNNMLRPNLEEYDEEIKFKGFIPDRDLIPGMCQFDNIIEGIQNSHKLLIVLTPKYVKDNNQKFISSLLLRMSIEMKKTIIPIILDSCSIPNILQNFTPIFFTKGSDWDRLRMSLNVNMSSDTDPEERMSAPNNSESEED